ncbi:MAG TPA: GNAT family N-acyltransferase [Bryobacteraceae bacterium]
MPNSGALLPLSLAPLLPPPLQRWAAPLEDALERWVVPPMLQQTIHQAQSHGQGAQFARQVLEQLGIEYALAPQDLAPVPARGPAILVANHPHGIVEGLILLVLLDTIRPDYKLMANSLVSQIDAMREHTILVNPFRTLTANTENRSPLRECIRWLAGGGLLTIFPAGEVAHLNWTEHSVVEPCWSTAAARLAVRMQAPVVPVFFEGSNSLQFHLAGTLHPGLRTIALPREFIKMRGKTVRVRFGSAIAADQLSVYRSAASATEYLRSRTLFLANRPWPAPHSSETSSAKPHAATVHAGVRERLLAAEVAALPADAELVRGDEFSVFVAQAGQIPKLLEEIGRSREEAFRLVGAGTGKETDLDWFDRHYSHLFLWSRRDALLAGAYRMALTDEVIRKIGIRGLYTSTLFHYKRGFFDRVGPALELGRSFVSPAYQKSYSPLLLLWKGIARFVQQHPQAAILFGAVTVSREYQTASRGLIASYLADRMLSDLAPLVQPRKKWRDPAAEAATVKQLAGAAASLEDISLSIADIEEDGKGVPVLIRQYLKAGGKLIAFNVDPAFSNSLDVLILTDLRSAPVSMLERCMGRAATKEFLEFHAGRRPV